MNQLKAYIWINTDIWILFFLIVEWFFLIVAVITQIFNPIVGLAIPIGISAKEAKAKMETHQVIVEIAISKCSI